MIQKTCLRSTSRKFWRITQIKDITSSYLNLAQTTRQSEVQQHFTSKQSFCAQSFTFLKIEWAVRSVTFLKSEIKVFYLINRPKSHVIKKFFRPWKSAGVSQEIRTENHHVWWTSISAAFLITKTNRKKKNLIFFRSVWNDKIMEVQ